MLRVFIKIAFFLPLSCFSLTTQPWLGDLFEADLVSGYTYRYYPGLQGACNSHASHDQIFSFSVSSIISTQCEIELELEVANTKELSWGMRSGVIQARYLWLNDIEGDPISLVTGINLRNVSKRSLHDVSCPYAARFNYELFSAVGKEWSEGPDWNRRMYVWLAIGIANQGSWWTRQELSYESNWCNRHNIKIFAEGNFGFGNLHRVLIDHFYGWGRYAHQSVDLGVRYKYQLSYYGTLSVSYAYRVFARTFPEKAHCVTLMYCFPFCLL